MRYYNFKRITAYVVADAGVVCPHIGDFLFLKARTIMNRKKQILKEIHHYKRLLDGMERSANPGSIIETIGIPKTIAKLKELEEEYHHAPNSHPIPQI